MKIYNFEEYIYICSGKRIEYVNKNTLKTYATDKRIKLKQTTLNDDMLNFQCRIGNNDFYFDFYFDKLCIEIILYTYCTTTSL